MLPVLSSVNMFILRSTYYWWVASANLPICESGFDKRQTFTIFNLQSQINQGMSLLLIWVTLTRLTGLLISSTGVRQLRKGPCTGSRGKVLSPERRDLRLVSKWSYTVMNNQPNGSADLSFVFWMIQLL